MSVDRHKPAVQATAAPAEPARGLVVGIDASRNRSGGAKAHLIGILDSLDPREHGIACVHVWSYGSLLAALPDAPWLVKHAPPALERSLPHQVWWQYRQLPMELRRLGCDALLSTDAGTVCHFEPAVVMSRDMLSFEPAEMRRYGVSLGRLRLYLLRHLQVRSLRQATGALFLTRYACEVIQRFTGPLRQVRIVPHGISERFRRPPASGQPPQPVGEVRCLYVSNVDVYKHQWNVVHAIGQLRARGHPVRLQLVGGGSGPARELLDRAVSQCDPQGAFVEVIESLPHEEIAAHLAQADLFVFASSCENMPNTLVEAMASGLPIASSDRGPMPEVLGDAGTYFDPEDPAAIAAAVERLLTEPGLCSRLALRAHARSTQFAWGRCAAETWAFLRFVAGPELARRPPQFGGRASTIPGQ